MRSSFPRAASAVRDYLKQSRNQCFFGLASDCSETEQCCSVTDPIQSETANPPLLETYVVSNR
jgi:hypothetical protein